MKLTLAEHFHSIKGEGLHTGVPMHFIRFAGCSVGKLVKNGLGELYPAPTLSTGAKAWMCTTYDGRRFWCDTDFNPKLETTVDEMVAETYEHHMCITGGEPLNHPSQIAELRRKFEGTIHIETSGTIDWTPPKDCWLTVSPKLKCLDSMIKKANEIKLLVDTEFDIAKVPSVMLEHPHVLLLPIHDNKPLDKYTKTNMDKALSLLKEHPSWRLTAQLHKMLGVK